MGAHEYKTIVTKILGPRTTSESLTCRGVYDPARATFDYKRKHSTNLALAIGGFSIPLLQALGSGPLVGSSEIYIARRSRPRGPQQAVRVGQRLSRRSRRSVRRGYVTGSMTTTKVGIQHLQLGDSILLERLEQAAGCCMLNAWPAKKAVLLFPDRVPANNIGLLRRHMGD